MSATFNTDLFANYFSKTSVQTIERMNAYEGAQEAYDKEEAERKQREEAGWGPCKSTEWDSKPDCKEDEDEWIDKKPATFMEMPVKKAADPADVIEINARCFEIKEMYLDELIKNISADKNIEKTSQDKELFAEATDVTGGLLKPMVRESAMRVASIIICDVIEKLNAFKEN